MLAEQTADLTRAEDCAAVTRGVDDLFHCAGAVSGAGASSATIVGGIATIVFGTIGVLASQALGRLAGFSVLVSSGTLLAVVLQAVAGGIDALRTLGLLETTASGAVRAEPVLAATRLSRGTEG